MILLSFYFGAIAIEKHRQSSVLSEEEAPKVKEDINPKKYFIQFLLLITGFLFAIFTIRQFGSHLEDSGNLLDAYLLVPVGMFIVMERLKSKNVIPRQVFSYFAPLFTGFFLIGVMHLAANLNHWR